MVDKLPIIGRELALIRTLSKQVDRALATRHERTNFRETERGGYFEVRIFDGPEYSGRVARITIELDRVEP